MTNSFNRLILVSLTCLAFIFGEGCSCSSNSAAGGDGGIQGDGRNLGDGIQGDLFQITGDTKVIPTPTKEHALFAVGEEFGTYNIGRVNTDGTDYHQLPGIPQKLKALSDIALTGPGKSMDIMRHLPTSLKWANNDAISLPNDLGKIFYWSVVSDNKETTEYLFLARPSGELFILDSCKCQYCFGGQMAVSTDGKLAAVARGEDSTSRTKIILYRLDETNWPTGNSIAFDATGTEWTGDVQYQSLTFGAKHLLFTAEETPTPTYKLLFSAPLDGSAKATKITLPNVGTQEAKYVKYYMAISDDGKTFAFVASPRSSSEGKEEVMTYRDGDTPSVTIVSNLPETYADRYGKISVQLEPRLAVSTAGKNVAFTSSSSGKFWVAGSDGSKKVEVSTNFEATVTEYGRFYWVSDDDLLFWAGDSEESLDLYRYQVSSGTLTPITKTGSSAAPYKTGTRGTFGTWFSPNKEFIYFVTSSGSETNILGINTKTFAPVEITTGLDIRHESRQLHQDFETLPNNANVWFIAKTAGTTNSSVYVFDQNAGSKATVLAQDVNTTDEVQKLTVSPSGSYVAYTTGTSSAMTPAEILHLLSTQGGQPQDLLKDLFLSQTYAWTPDGSAIVIGAGENGGKQSLYKVPITGEKTVLYKESPGYMEVIGAYKGTQNSQ